jgi:tRNA-Thr(GGU) m(6)t(6)A37 methyltransferase TsaA
MKDAFYSVRPVGVVRSVLKSREECPKQGREGAPEAWLEIDPAFSTALDGLAAGQEILVLTWLHEGRRDMLRVHLRGDPDAPIMGVFATRSPDRPNPIRPAPRGSVGYRQNGSSHGTAVGGPGRNAPH